MTQITLKLNGISHTFNHTAHIKDAMRVIDHKKFESVQIKPTEHADKVREYMIHRR